MTLALTSKVETVVAAVEQATPAWALNMLPGLGDNTTENMSESQQEQDPIEHASESQQEQASRVPRLCLIPNFETVAAAVQLATPAWASELLADIGESFYSKETVSSS